MSGCAREALLGGLAGDAELGADLCPGRAGLAGSGDGGGQGAFGSVCLLVGGSNTRYSQRHLPLPTPPPLPAHPHRPRRTPPRTGLPNAYASTIAQTPESKITPRLYKLTSETSRGAHLRVPRTKVRRRRRRWSADSKIHPAAVQVDQRNKSWGPTSLTVGAPRGLGRPVADSTHTKVRDHDPERAPRQTRDRSLTSRPCPCRLPHTHAAGRLAAC